LNAEEAVAAVATPAESSDSRRLNEATSALIGPEMSFSVGSLRSRSAAQTKTRNEVETKANQRRVGTTQT
jgi:hypothetical protein